MVRTADYFGMTASTLCALHCLGTPLLLTLFPVLGLRQQQDDAIHRYMVVLVTLPVVLALVPGFFAHRRWQVLVLGGFGLACFVAAALWIGPRYGEVAETVLALIGGAHLFAAHFKNRSFCRSCAMQRQSGICSSQTCNIVANGTANEQ